MKFIIAILLGLVVLAVLALLILWIGDPDDYDDPTGDGDCDE